MYDRLFDCNSLGIMYQTIGLIAERDENENTGDYRPLETETAEHYDYYVKQFTSMHELSLVDGCIEDEVLIVEEKGNHVHSEICKTGLSNVKDSWLDEENTVLDELVSVINSEELGTVKPCSQLIAYSLEN